MAHEAAAEALLGNWSKYEDVAKDINNRDGVLDYIEYVKSIPGKLYVEQKLTMNSVGPVDCCWGTSDVVICDYDSSNLWIIDYKHGHGIVDVKDNKQLIIYAIGALEKFGHDPRWIEDPAIVIVIFQPNSNDFAGPKNWIYHSDDIQDWINHFSYNIHLCEEAKEDPLQHLESGDHCRWCPAKPICPELKHVAQKTAQLDFAEKEQTMPVVENLEIEQIVQVLDNEKLVIDWMKSVKAYAKHLIGQGVQIPGYDIKDAYGHRKWSNEKEAVKRVVASLKEEYEIDDIYEHKLKSPNKIKKLVNNAKELEELVERPKTGAKLIPAKTKPNALSSAKEDFND
jgi:hypothetical protein